jgi:hypothetical protein
VMCFCADKLNSRLWIFWCSLGIYGISHGVPLFYVECISQPD